ncbi:MAG: hypothetical protein H0U32_00205 [Thermoleophilaceae bacterium]|nr:hypothetical protein [Thermoleophilaceae bacterium]
MLRRARPRLRKKIRGRSVLVLTSSQRYTIRGVRNGSTPRFIEEANGKRIRRSYKVGINPAATSLAARRAPVCSSRSPGGRGGSARSGWPTLGSCAGAGRRAPRRFLDGF